MPVRQGWGLNWFAPLAPSQHRGLFLSVHKSPPYFMQHRWWHWNSDAQLQGKQFSVDNRVSIADRLEHLGGLVAGTSVHDTCHVTGLCTGPQSSDNFDHWEFTSSDVPANLHKPGSQLVACGLHRKRFNKGLEGCGHDPLGRDASSPISICGFSRNALGQLVATSWLRLPVRATGRLDCLGWETLSLKVVRSRQLRQD